MTILRMAHAINAKEDLLEEGLREGSGVLSIFMNDNKSYLGIAGSGHNDRYTLYAIVESIKN